MDDLYSLVPVPHIIDCYEEVYKLYDEAKNLSDGSLLEKITMLITTYECSPVTTQIISNFFQTGNLSMEDREFLEKTYVLMYGIFAVGDDGKIVTLIIKN